MSDNQFISIPTEDLSRITSDQAWHYKIIPAEGIDSNNSFWICETQNLSNTLNQLQVIIGPNVALESASEIKVRNSLLRYYPKSNSSATSNASSDQEDFLLQLFLEAKSLDSSDIHVEIYQSDCRIRMRKDGVLVERHKLQLDEYPSLINRVKIKANLDISEKRLPQDGRINIEELGNRFDVRVSVLPTFFGEKIVMRILQTDSSHVDLNKVGLAKEQYNEYWKAVQKQNGIVLISGPTGSGKTTTLYSTLKRLNTNQKNILTIEDPIEYTLQGVNQVQVKENIGYTFAKAMRSFLRQDPDIIMLGEIRDGETAQMAIRAALTGHLVLSTIHTNSAWGTISRLIDMGIPPFLIANTLNVSVAQRLLRTLCTNCKTEDFESQNFEQLADMKISLATLHKANGCSKCYFTGYLGRKAVFEVIPITSDLIESIKENVHEIGSFLENENIITIKNRVIAMLEKGETSFEEAYPILLSC